MGNIRNNYLILVNINAKKIPTHTFLSNVLVGIIAEQGRYTDINTVENLRLIFRITHFC